MKLLLTSILTRMFGKPRARVSSSSVTGQVLDQLPLAMLVLDEAGKIIFSNEAVLLLLGCSGKQLANVCIYDLFSAADNQKLTVLLAAKNSCPDAGYASPEADVRLSVCPGKVHSLKMSISRFAWDGEDFSCMSLRLPAFDAHELQVTRERALKFQQISDNKSSFLASMSHEIRTPLSGMLGMIDLLTSTTLTPQQRIYLSSLKKSSKTLHGQINSVLDYSKIEAGLVETDLVPFDLDEILQTVVDAFSPAANLKGLTLQLYQSLEHKQFFGDPHHISKVLNNLVSNALKFTPHGSVTVAAWVQTPLQQNTCRLTISVTDTGIGIAIGQLSRIFDSFAQASPSVSRNYGGSGLGLFISEQLVTLMGGEISVASEPGKGSTFTFWLDLKPCFLMSELVETVPTVLHRLAGARILVVEDDLTNRMLLEAWLVHAQASVVCCSDGREALEALSRSACFDAILMDISMPVLNGLEATQHIRLPRLQDSPARQRYLADIPIIGISGHVFNEDVVQCLNAGMTACLFKPLSRAEMLLKLTSLLGLGQTNDLQA